MIEKVYRATCYRCWGTRILAVRTLEAARDTLNTMGWKRLADTDICPACQARIGNVQVIPEGERHHAHRH